MTQHNQTNQSNQPNPDKRFLATFMQCVAEAMAHPVNLQATDALELHDAMLYSIDPANAAPFFMQRGYDGADITEQALTQCAYALGLSPSKPQRTFADMLARIKQHQQGLITDSELIMALQCTPHQLTALLQYSSLPHKAQGKVSITDWDAEEGEAPVESEANITNDDDVDTELDAGGERYGRKLRKSRYESND
jgi:hypothetical protein